MNNVEFFTGIAKSITSSLDIGEALADTLHFLQYEIPVDVISLFYFDFNQESLFCLAEADTASARSMFDNPLNCGPLAPFIHPVADRRRTLSTIPDVDVMSNEEIDWYYRNNPVMSQRYQKYRGGSVLRLWLHIGEDMTGTFLVISKQPNLFTDDIRKLFEQVRDPITIAMSNARRYQELVMLKSRLEDENRAMRLDMIRETGNQPVGAEFGLKDVLTMARQVANMPSPVLLLGETGTGKEVIANAIHMFSDRRDNPMIKVQAGAIPETLLDSELFGHERGAFTGAIGTFRGRFERAEGGTLFLDEIGELTLEAQIKLLRVLQEHKIERLGGDRTIDVDVRIIAATNRNLAQMVTKGSFREDLWFRLNVFPIHLPPLRYRKEDIPSLVNHFVQKKSHELNLQQQPLIRHSVLKSLIDYDWPGNVRELQNVIERALILQPGPYLEIPDSLLKSFRTYPESDEPASYQTIISPVDDFPSLDSIQTRHIREALRLSHGRVSGIDGAADLLKINPNTLRARMKKLGIDYRMRRSSPHEETH
ncbi:sigma 54-interacting transcriptional regulator [bacterium]|nr:sigma 54-interacting transcriptional regulator [candidate division CSSED10-310 bacterium]